MAYTARAEADCKEFFDDPKTLQTKIRRLAALIKASKHFCAFTGAGISTAAGIADFRSGINTALDTGAGAWAKKAAVQTGKRAQIKKAKRRTRVIKAIPTQAHMALVSLMTSAPQFLKHVISQNTDGLHRRSGIPVDQLSELHGNRCVPSSVCSCAYRNIQHCRTQHARGVQPVQSRLHPRLSRYAQEQQVRQAHRYMICALCQYPVFFAIDRL